jgi:hypothetical protein
MRSEAVARRVSWETGRLPDLPAGGAFARGVGAADLPIPGEIFDFLTKAM